MKMDDPLLMGIHNLLRQQKTHRQIFTDLPRHIIALSRVDAGIFIGIFLIDLFVVALNERQDLTVRRIGFSGDLTLVTVTHILLCDLITAFLHDSDLYHILYTFHVDSMGSAFNLIRYPVRHICNLKQRQAFVFLHLFIRFLNCITDLFWIKLYFFSVSLDNPCPTHDYNFSNPSKQLNIVFFYLSNTRCCVLSYHSKV